MGMERNCPFRCTDGKWKPFFLTPTVLGEHTGMKTELCQCNIKIQGFIYGAHVALMWLGFAGEDSGRIWSTSSTVAGRLMADEFDTRHTNSITEGAVVGLVGSSAAAAASRFFLLLLFSSKQALRSFLKELTA